MASDDEDNQDIEVALENVPIMLKEGSAEEKLAAAKFCRRALCQENHLPIAQFHENGTIKMLVKVLKRSNSSENLLHECLWALGIITRGEILYTDAVIEAGAALPLLQIMMGHSDMVALDCILVVGNIAGASADNRDALLPFSPMLSVQLAFERFRMEISSLRLVCWLLASICRHEARRYLIDDIICVLPFLHNWLIECTDRRCCADLCWALAWASRYELVIDAIIEHKIHMTVCTMIHFDKALVLVPAIRVIGNMVYGTDVQTEAAVQAGAISAVGSHIYHQNPRVVKEVCWVLSNVSAGTAAQVDQLIESKILAYVITDMNMRDSKNKAYNVTTICNVANSKNDQHLLYLIDNDVLSAIARMLPRINNDRELTIELLVALRHLFECAKRNGQLEHCIQRFTMARGGDELRHLMNLNVPVVSTKSHDLLNDYIDGE